MSWEGYELSRAKRRNSVLDSRRVLARRLVRLQLLRGHSWQNARSDALMEQREAVAASAPTFRAEKPLE